MPNPQHTSLAAATLAKQPLAKILGLVNKISLNDTCT